MHAEMAATRQAGKVIGGHYASPDLGLPFHGYVAGGIEDDHEGTRMEDAVARVRQGMKAMLRYGSAWHDVEKQVKAVTEGGWTRATSFCAPMTRTRKRWSRRAHGPGGEMLLNRAWSRMTAIQMCTINTAEHFGLSREWA
jgi:adenine deaminase